MGGTAPHGREPSARSLAPGDTVGPQTLCNYLPVMRSVVPRPAKQSQEAHLARPEHTSEPARLPAGHPPAPITTFIRDLPSSAVPHVHPSTPETTTYTQPCLSSLPCAHPPGCRGRVSWARRQWHTRWGLAGEAGCEVCEDPRPARMLATGALTALLPAPLSAARARLRPPRRQGGGDRRGR